MSHMIRISVDQVKKWSDGSHDNDLLDTYILIQMRLIPDEGDHCVCRQYGNWKRAD